MEYHRMALHILAEIEVLQGCILQNGKNLVYCRFKTGIG